MKKLIDPTITAVVLVALMFFWYNILGIIWEVMEGEVKAGLSVLLAIMVYAIVGKKIAKYLS